MSADSEYLPPPLEQYHEETHDWEAALYDYLRHWVQKTFGGETPGGAAVLYDTLVMHEKLQPQDLESGYFRGLAGFVMGLAEDLPELEGQAPALARLFCQLVRLSMQYEGEPDPEEQICGEDAVMNYRDTADMICPGFYKHSDVIMPDPNFSPGASHAAFAQLGREYSRFTRLWSFTSHLDAISGFAIQYGPKQREPRSYPGWMAVYLWNIRRLEEARINLACWPELHAVTSVFAPLVYYLRDEDALAKSHWGQREGLDSVRKLKLKLRELAEDNNLPDLMRAYLAALFEDMTIIHPLQLDTAPECWRTSLLCHLKDAPSGEELYSKFVATQTRNGDCDLLYNTALQLVDAIFDCAECEGHIAVLAHTYTMVVGEISSRLGEEDDNMAHHVYINGICPRLRISLIRPGYHLVDSMILPDPSWQGTLSLPTLAAYSRTHASWLRLWCFIGHLDARAKSPLLPQHSFAGHFVLSFWTPDCIRRARTLPGHHAELDMLAAALYPLRDVLANPSGTESEGREMREGLVNALNEVLICDDVVELTRARLAMIIEEIEHQL